MMMMMMMGSSAACQVAEPLAGWSFPGALCTGTRCAVGWSEFGIQRLLGTQSTKNQIVRSGLQLQRQSHQQIFCSPECRRSSSTHWGSCTSIQVLYIWCDESNDENRTSSWISWISEAIKWAFLQLESSKSPTRPTRFWKIPRVQRLSHPSPKVSEK